MIVGDKKVVPLTRAIDVRGQPLSVLELREPTAKDVMELGYPYIVITDGGAQGVQPLARVAARYVVKLASIPRSSVEQLSAPDLQTLQGAVMEFFGSAEGDSDG